MPSMVVVVQIHLGRDVGLSGTDKEGRDIELKVASTEVSGGDIGQQLRKR